MLFNSIHLLVWLLFCYFFFILFWKQFFVFFFCFPTKNFWRWKSKFLSYNRHNRFKMSIFSSAISLTSSANSDQGKLCYGFSTFSISFDKFYRKNQNRLKLRHRNQRERSLDPLQRNSNQRHIVATYVDVTLKLVMISTIIWKFIAPKSYCECRIWMKGKRKGNVWD